MTSPGGGQNINLAALWIPVLPDTSKMGEEMAKAGAQAKSQFEQGFNSGTSPEAMGSSFSNTLMSSINRGLKDIDLPFLGNASKRLEQFGIDVDNKLVTKLRGEATSALRSYTAEYDKLQALQQRSMELESEINNRRAGGLSAAGIIPAMQEQARVQSQLNTQVGLTSKSYEEYSGKLGSLNDAQGAVSAGGSMMAGIMGGLMVAGVQQLMGGIEDLAEHLIEGVVEGFKMSIEVGRKFAETMLEVGESFEHIGIQITEFSGASGESLEELEHHAQAVFNSLDVAGKDTGKTMAQFAAQLDAEPGAALDNLTKHVTELQGRFSDLKTQDIASIFVAFKTPLQDTDSALASLLQSARNSGQDIGQLTASLSGEAAVTLTQAGLNLQQSGAFMGELLKLGPSGRSVMMGLNAAMKEFGKEGLSFADGMKLAGQQLKTLGDSAEGQDLAEKLFGTRRWPVAMAAVQSYLDIVNEGPDAFNANASSLDAFLTKTRTLENQWEEVKHKAMAAFEPVGMAAIEIVGKGLDKAVQFVTSHMDQIHSAITKGGVYLIEFVRDAQLLAEGLLDFFAPAVNAIDTLMGSVMYAFGAFIHTSGEVISNIPGMKSIGDGMIEAGNAAGDFGDKLNKLNVGDKMTKLSQWLKDHPVKVGEAADSWTNFSDKVYDSMQASTDAVANAKLTPGGLNSELGIGGAPLGIGSAAAPGIFAPSTPGGGLPPGIGLGPSDGSRGDPGAGGLPLPGGKHVADWDAIAAKEGGGQWNTTYTTGVPEGGGLQIKPDTWAQYGGLALAPKPFLASKQDQILIAERILNGWNGIPGQGPKAWENGKTYVGYDRGGPAGSPGYKVTSGSGHGDDVPAMLGKGEFVWDTQTVDKYGWLIAALHGQARGFDQGGGASGSGSLLDDAILYGVPQGHYAEPGQERDNLAKGMADCSSAIEALVNHLEGKGLTAPSGMFTGNEAEFLMAHGFIQGEGGPGDFRVGFNSHHTQATLPGGTPFNWGSEAAAQNRGIGGTGADDPAFTSHYFMPLSQGTGPNGGYPGLPGQFGGSGAYGGETADQAYSAQKAVREAQDRAADMDAEIARQKREIQDIKDQLAQVDKPKLGALGLPEVQTPEQVAAAADKKKQLNEQLADATESLTKSQRERSEQDGEIAQAQRKQQESGFRKPGTAGSATQSAEGKAGESLGQGLLAGIGQELGLGDVLGKSPMDWGIVKLAEGLFNYANGLGDAIFGKSGGIGGGTPGGTQGLGGGVAQGILGSLGMSMPNIGAAPNVIPGHGPGIGTPASGAGFGPLPGPAVVNNDNSIHVSSDVSDRAVMAPVQAQQNSSNSASFQYQGGLPAQ